jgi:hypothetical protein
MTKKRRKITAKPRKPGVATTRIVSSLADGSTSLMGSNRASYTSINPVHSFLLEMITTFNIRWPGVPCAQSLSKLYVNNR